MDAGAVVPELTTLAGVKVAAASTDAAPWIFGKEKLNEHAVAIVESSMPDKRE
jgi:hypothetical protein